MPAARPSAATLRQEGRGQACPGPSRWPPLPQGPSLLVQGDVSVGLCHTWPLGASLPECTGPGLRRGPGTAAILRVPPLQGLPGVQAECDRDDRQQADVPGAGGGQPQSGCPRKESCCCGPTPVPFLHRTRPAGLHDHPLRKSSPNGWWEHRRPLPAPALAPQPCSVMDTSTQTHHDSASWET